MSGDEFLQVIKDKQTPSRVESPVLYHWPTHTRWVIWWYPNGTDATEQDGFSACYIKLIDKPLEFKSIGK